jgi:Arc/MetJ-type ribon-helix-helix transcriptional regulator
VFDSADPESPSDRASSDGRSTETEDERIALRCHRRELRLLDSFVASGEFRSRSELMRCALREFLRARALADFPTARAEVPGSADEAVSVRLRRDEAETLRAYAELVANGSSLGDVVAQLVRRGALEAKVEDLVASARRSRRRSGEERARLDSLLESGEELERRGVVGR